MRKLNGASSDCSRATLHQHRSPFDGFGDMNRSVGGYTGNSEAGALFHWHAFGQWGHLRQRDRDIFGGSAESWLVQQAQYDLAHVHRDRIKLKRLEIA